MYRLADVEKSTGLNLNFIRKCIKKVGALTPYIKRGTNNSIIFEQDALVIFDQIKQLKETNLSIDLINEKLQKSIQSDTETPAKQDAKPIQTKGQTALEPYVFLEKLEAKHQRILELEQQLHGIKLLTGGKTEEQLQSEKTEKEQAKLQIAEKLTAIEGLEDRLFMWNKRKSLLKEVKELNRKL